MNGCTSTLHALGNCSTIKNGRKIFPVIIFVDQRHFASAYYCKKMHGKGPFLMLYDISCRLFWQSSGVDLFNRTQAAESKIGCQVEARSEYVIHACSWPIIKILKIVRKNLKKNRHKPIWLPQCVLIGRKRREGKRVKPIVRIYAFHHYQLAISISITLTTVASILN